MDRVRTFFVSYSAGWPRKHNGYFTFSSTKVGEDLMRHGISEAEKRLPNQSWVDSLVLLTFNEIPSE